MITLLAMLASASAPGVCEKLQQDFVNNEKAYASAYTFQSRLLASDLEYEASMRDAERDLAIAEARSRAAGNYVPRRPKKEKDSEIRRKKMAEIDEQHLERGDRITTLLLANKCAPPDHVTSRFTYAEKSAD